MKKEPNNMNEFLQEEPEGDIIKHTINNFEELDERLSSTISIYRNIYTNQPFKTTNIYQALKYFDSKKHGTDIAILFNQVIDTTISDRSYKNITSGPYIILDVDTHSPKEIEGIASDGGLERIKKIISADPKCIVSGYSKSMNGYRALYICAVDTDEYRTELDITAIDYQKLKQRVKYSVLQNHLSSIGLKHIRDYNDISFKKYSQVTFPMGKIISKNKPTEEMFLNISDEDIIEQYELEKIKEKRVAKMNYNNSNGLSQETIPYVSLDQLSPTDRLKIDHHFKMYPIRYQDGKDFFRYRSANIESRKFLYELFCLYYNGGSTAPRIALESFETFNQYVDNTMKGDALAHWKGFFSSLDIPGLK